MKTQITQLTPQEILRQLDRQWEKLTTHLAVLWVIVLTLLVYSITITISLANLEAEMYTLKSRQTQKLTACQPVAKETNTASSPSPDAPIDGVRSSWTKMDNR